MGSTSRLLVLHGFLPIQVLAMILGIGTDILNISRVEKLLSKFGTRFIERVLSSEELLKYQSIKGGSINYLARRFCIKEAFSKALGTGIGELLSFKDISIENNKLGKPYVVKSKALLGQISKILNVAETDIKIDVSVSDDEPFVVGFVVISSCSG